MGKALAFLFDQRFLAPIGVIGVPQHFQGFPGAEPNDGHAVGLKQGGQALGIHLQRLERLL